MSRTSSVPCVVILFILLWRTNTLSPVSECPVLCLCQKSPLLNCSSSGLSGTPLFIPTTTTSLDLSHNALTSLVPLRSARRRLTELHDFWVANNALESLSLCRGRNEEKPCNLTPKTHQCVSWAPNLQLLSAERNRLKCLPRGLGSIKSLQVLRVSHNWISEIGQYELARCTQLRELHLQHNRINTIHPQAFKDLQNLQILDLRNNLLTFIPMPSYLHLRNLNALVDVSGNRWRCDCNLRAMRRWLSFGSELGYPAWKVVCFSPSHHAVKDLLSLKESDLMCSSPTYNTPQLYKEETLDEGTEVLLSCSIANEDFIRPRWWTPDGQILENQPILLITNITEQQSGLYVCISGGNEEHISVFKLQVQKTGHYSRVRREVQNDLDQPVEEGTLMNAPTTRQASSPDLVLAVCLSVFITFIVAFVLGFVLRPLLEKLCRNIRNKRNSSHAADSQTASSEPRPYVNEGFSDTDDQVQGGRSRVTFGEVIEVEDEGGNVPYYVTVEDAKSDSSSESNSQEFYENIEHVQRSEPAAAEVESVEVNNLSRGASHNHGNSVEETKNISQRLGHPKAESTTVLEIEPIPDSEDTPELDSRSMSSVSSDKDHEIKEFHEQSVDCNQSSAIIVPKVEQATVRQEVTIPGFTTDPFSEMPYETKEENVDFPDPDLWNDSGETFSFTDSSPRSSSRISQRAVLDYPLYENEMSVDKQSDKSSICNSSESEESDGGLTEHTVNPQREEESDIHNDSQSENDVFLGGQDTSPDKTVHFRQDIVTLVPSDIHTTFNQEDSFDDGSLEDAKDCSDASNSSSDYEEEPIQYHVHPVYRSSQQFTGHLETAEQSDDNSPSEDEDKQAEYENFPRRLEIKPEPDITTEHVIPVRNPDTVVNINFDNSSSSTDKEEITGREGPKKRFKGLSGLSTSLFSRSGTEAKMEAQPTTKTTNDEGKTGGFLGLLSTNRQPEAPEESFFETIGQTFTHLPKIKRSLLFSISDHQPAGSTDYVKKEFKTNQSNPVSSWESSQFEDSSAVDELIPTTKEVNFLGQVGPIAEVPKVKQYIHFRQLHFQTSSHSPSTSSSQEVTTPQLLTKAPMERSDAFPESEISPPSKSSFFGQIGSVGVVPRVKRYLKFTQSDPQILSQSKSTNLKEEMLIPQLGSKTQLSRSDSSFDEECSPTSKGVHFFGQIEPVHGEIKVKRYIHFTQSDPQSTSLSQETINSQLVAKTPPKRPVSLSKGEHGPGPKGDSFFGHLGSVGEVTKVKRYIHFTQSDPQTSVHSESMSSSQKSTQLVNKPPPKIPDSTSENERSPGPIRVSFFGQTGSVPKVTRVKKYIQFTSSVSQPSLHSSSIRKEKITSQIPNKTPQERADAFSESERSPTTRGDNFFRQIESVDGVTRVKRYIHFTQSDSQTPVHKPSVTSRQEMVTSQLLSKSPHNIPDSLSEGELSPGSKGDSFFGQMGSVGVVSKVKRYLKFKQSDPQTSVHKPSESLLKKETVIPPSASNTPRRSDPLFEEHSPTTKGDNFFGHLGSVGEVTKVKRYIHFTQSDPQTSVHSESMLSRQKSPQSVNKLPSKIPDSTSEDERGPGPIRVSFFGQTGSVPKVTRVKKYIQFTPSESQPSLHSSSIRKEKITPQIPNKTPQERVDAFSESERSPTTRGDNFFGQIGPVGVVSKVKRYLKFKQSDPQTSIHKPSKSLLKKETVIPPSASNTPRRSDPSFEEHSPTTKGSNFFGHLGSVGAVSRVKRYLKFTQSDHYSSLSSPSTSLKKEMIIPQLVSKTPPTQSNSSFEKDCSLTTKGDHFFGPIEFDGGVPKVKKYIHFSRSDPQISTDATSKRVTSQLVTTAPPSFSDSERYLAKVDSFFGQISPFFDGVPKVKRYINFSHSDPQISGHSPSPPLSLETITSQLVTRTPPKITDSSSEGELRPGPIRVSFFGQVGSIPEVTRVKRYLKFTPTESQPSLHSSSTRKERIKPQIPNKTPLERSDAISPPSLHSPSRSQEKIKPQLATTRTLENTTLSDSELSPTTKGGNFFGQLGSVGVVTRVKRYLKFTQSAPHIPVLNPLANLTKEIVIPQSPAKRPSTRPDSTYSPTSAGDHFFGQIDSVPGVPKVKRYLYFSQLDPQISDHPTPTSLRQETIKSQLLNKTPPKVSDSTSEEELSPGPKGDSFFGQIRSVGGVQRVKRYIQFTPTNSQPSIPSPLTSQEKVATTKSLERSHAFSESEYSPTNKRDNFFGQIGVVPRVKRYIHFSQSDPQISTSVSQKRVISQLGNTAPPKMSESLSDSELYLAKEHSFFGQINSSLDGVPKVKRYIHFSHSDPQTSGHSPSSPLRQETVTSKSVTKTPPRAELSPGPKGDSIFGQLSTSFDGVPKVKRYIHFTPSKSQPSLPASSTSQERITPQIPTKTPLDRSDVFSDIQVSPTTKRDDVFGQIGSVAAVPRVKRYLKFTQSDPQTSVHKPPASLHKELVIPPSASKTPTRSDPSFEGEHSMTSKEANFYGPIESVAGVPKVKRYIHFSQFDPQTTIHKPSATLREETITSPLVTKTSPMIPASLSEGELGAGLKEDNFFGQIKSGPGVPKVKRYLHFSQSDPQSSVSSPSINQEKITQLATKTLLERSDAFTESELSPTTKGGNVFGQIGSVGAVPTVKRYLKFTQSDPQTSVHKPPASLHKELVIPPSASKTPTKPDPSFEGEHSMTSKEANFFGPIESVAGVPKVKRYIHFSQFDPQTTIHKPSATSREETITSQLVTKTPASSSEGELGPGLKEDNFFGQIKSGPVVPKVKQYLHFSQFDPQTTIHKPSATLREETITSPLVTKTSPMIPASLSEGELGPGLKEDNFFGQIKSGPGVPKVKRYLHFSQSDPQSSVSSPSINQEKITPQLATNTPLERSDAFSKSELSPITKGGNVFGQIGSVGAMPRVKRYIKFTQSDPQTSVHKPPASLHKELVIPPPSASKTPTRSDPSFEGEHSMTSKEANFYGPIESVAGVPKVKRYIHFSQFDPQTTIHKPSATLREETITSQLVTKTSQMIPASLSEGELGPGLKEDSFFGQIKSGPGVPKVKRYLHFSQSDPQSSVSSPSINQEKITQLATKTPLERSDAFSKSELSPTTKGGNVFGQIGSVGAVPTVKRYLKFTPSESQPEGHSSTSLRTETLTSELLTKNPIKTTDFSFDTEQSLTAKGDSRLMQIGQVDEVPKVKRYIHFTLSEHQPLVHSSSTSLSQEWVTPQLVTETPTRRADSSLEVHHHPTMKGEDDYDLHQISLSVEGVPKVKRYLQFTQSEPQSPSVNSSQKETSQLLTITSSTSAPSTKGELRTTFRGDTFLDQIGSFDSVPRGKRNIRFTQSEPFQFSDPVPRSRRHVVMDVPSEDIHDPVIQESPTASPRVDNAREYLRDSLEARQRQERRRLLFQQKRRAMDGFSLSSRSSTSQEGDE